MTIRSATLGVGGRMRRLITFLMAAASLPAAAQTQVDLRTQSKSVDFTAASSTKPLKAGVTLPASCALGEMFFKTDAPAGLNVFGCVNTNTWQLQAGAGTVTVENGGTVVGTQAVQNFVVGPGLVNAMTDTGTRINIQQNVDTAVVQTRACDAVRAGGRFRQRLYLFDESDPDSLHAGDGIAFEAGCEFRGRRGDDRYRHAGPNACQASRRSHRPDWSGSRSGAPLFNLV
jgi:hypothetical protein